MVDELFVEGSTPAMFQPYVTPSSGFTVVPWKCWIVCVEFRTVAPPTVVDIALS